jgi:hypothetical protein
VLKQNQSVGSEALHTINQPQVWVACMQKETLRWPSAGPTCEAIRARVGPSDICMRRGRLLGRFIDWHNTPARVTGAQRSTAFGFRPNFRDISRRLT